ncbi:Tellurite resistance protein TehB [Mesobacillus persicus]|uniref:Tellurite resistance protein TehB n=1 Tax=Mesobacillus persicus TaxID=930146 RepID=A0A1H8I7E5_9BACI|nr:class I SAM-dependent methyltransferase [Mesobacillus persicus]SEN64065.1 Tellurite resistance protein TehB [Mesobacillus persicus]
MNPKSKWNIKYIDRLNTDEEISANARLMNLSAYFTGGEALDFACGLGGNSMFLARSNYQVHAKDISEVAIEYLKEQAENQQLAIFPILCDLTDVSSLQLKDCSVDLIVITYYLDRALFPIVKSIIKENGFFFMETFYRSSQTENQGVSNKFKLEPQELLTEFGDWKVLFYEENEHEGRQTIFCQKV